MQERQRCQRAAVAATPSEDWVKSCVVYQIFVRNFSSSGDLPALRSRLDALASDLGVDVLWLMPLHPIGLEMRKGRLGCPYAVRNYEEICSELGTADDLKELVAAAHARGMKVIVDWVANHTSWDSHLIVNRPHLFKRGRRKKKNVAAAAVVRDDDEAGDGDGDLTSLPQLQQQLVLDDKEVTIEDVREKLRREREGLDDEVAHHDDGGGRANVDDDDEEEVILPPMEAWWDVAALDYGVADSDDEDEDYQADALGIPESARHRSGVDQEIVIQGEATTTAKATRRRRKKTEAQRELGDYMVGVMKSWVRDYDIDGFRCDVSEMVPTFFWRRVVREIKAEVKPSLLMISEGTLPEHHIGAFDLTYAWDTYDALTAIVRREQPASHLHHVLQAEAQEFPEGTLRLRFAANHDKNFTDGSPIEHFGGAPAALAASAFIFTVGGYDTIRSVPMLYNGDEVANTLRLSLFDKTVIPWDDLVTSDTGKRFHRHYKQLIALRRRKPDVFVHGTMARATTSHDDRVFAFVRTSTKAAKDVHGANEEAVVVLNLSDQAISNVAVTLPPLDRGQAPPASAIKLVDWYAAPDARQETELQLDHTSKLLTIPALPPFGFHVLGLVSSPC